MTSYRVCLDCDKNIAVEGDQLHSVIRDAQGDEVLIGCEGYRHRELENAVHEDRAISVEEAKEAAETVIRAWVETGSIMAHEDFADAFGALGTMFESLSTEMVYQVYKDDKESAVTEHMKMLRAQSFEQAFEARMTLRQFGIGRNAE